MLRLAWGVSALAMGALWFGCGDGAGASGSPDLLVGGGDAALVDGAAPAPDLDDAWIAERYCSGNADCNKLGGGTLCCSGFCVNPASDVKNCGGCGLACAPVPSGLPGCASGACVIASCDPRHDDCDRDPRNGCEVDTSSDDAHCGTCARACAPGTHCMGGSCK